MLSVQTLWFLLPASRMLSTCLAGEPSFVSEQRPAAKPVMGV